VESAKAGAARGQRCNAGPTIRFIRRFESDFCFETFDQVGTKDSDFFCAGLSAFLVATGFFQEFGGGGIPCHANLPVQLKIDSAYLLSVIT